MRGETGSDSPNSQKQRGAGNLQKRAHRKECSQARRDQVRRQRRGLGWTRWEAAEGEGGSSLQEEPGVSAGPGWGSPPGRLAAGPYL